LAPSGTPPFPNPAPRKGGGTDREGGWHPPMKAFEKKKKIPRRSIKSSRAGRGAARPAGSSPVNRPVAEPASGALQGRGGRGPRSKSASKSTHREDIPAPCKTAGPGGDPAPRRARCFSPCTFRASQLPSIRHRRLPPQSPGRFAAPWRVFVGLIDVTILVDPPATAFLSSIRSASQKAPLPPREG